MLALKISQRRTAHGHHPGAKACVCTIECQAIGCTCQGLEGSTGAQQMGDSTDGNLKRVPKPNESPTTSLNRNPSIYMYIYIYIIVFCFPPCEVSKLNNSSKSKDLVLFPLQKPCLVYLNLACTVSIRLMVRQILIGPCVLGRP